MRALDTSAEAATRQHRLHQALGTEARFALAMSMSELAQEFAKAGLRNRHPEYAEAELLRELTNELHGRLIGRK
ncbi:MAG: hypothetical protein ABIV11_06435 [Gemmatimonadaceae bacterium]